MNDNREKVKAFAEKMLLICNSLADGLFHREIAEAHGVSVGVVRFIADQLNWNVSWTNATELEKRIYAMLAQGNTLTEVRHGLCVDLATILAISRRAGLTKQVRDKVRRGIPLVKLNEKQPQSADQLYAQHADKYSKAIEMWTAGKTMTEIAMEYGTSVSHMRKIVEELRDLHGWFTPRQNDVLESKRYLDRQKKLYRMRRRWKEAQKYWDMGCSISEICANTGDQPAELKRAIVYCRKHLNMFKQQFTKSSG